MARLIASGFLLSAAMRPACAASVIRLADGSQLAVWQERMRTRPADQVSDASVLAYSITADSGTISGVVGGTSDSARDASPRLAIDPSTGSVVLVWSRFDGVYNKIAYARLAGTTWVDLHFLTFGSGDDLDPRVSTARDGAFLFWRWEAGRYFSAPVDLASGRLLGPPRELILGPMKLRGSMGVQGAQDVPVNLNGKGGSNHLGCLKPIGNLGLQGSSDVPVVIDHSPGGGSGGGNNHNKGASLWGVVGRSDCRATILALPDPTETVERIISFVNGWAREIREMQVPATIPDGFGDQTAAIHLNAYCN